MAAQVTGFAVLLRQGESFTRPGPTVGFAVCAITSFGLLTPLPRDVKAGSAYAAWTGFGTSGTAVAGMVILGETTSVLKPVSISLVPAGIVELNASGVTA